jgi:N-acyl-L-homoserine lactone synthetase
MQYVTFDFLGQHRHDTAFRQYLRLRKRFFVDLLGWDIPHDDDVEMDQYDNPCAHYALVLRGGTVVGGARLMPTTAAWGRHSYMLRDARLGAIAIPAHVVPEEIVSPEVWECTRLVVSDDLVSQADRLDCLSSILWGCWDVMRDHGGREVVSLSPVSMARTLRQLGYAARQVGEPYREAADGRRYVMLRTPALAPAYAMAAE